MRSMVLAFTVGCGGEALKGRAFVINDTTEPVEVELQTFGPHDCEAPFGAWESRLLAPRWESTVTLAPGELVAPFEEGLLDDQCHVVRVQVPVVFDPSMDPFFVGGSVAIDASSARRERAPGPPERTLRVDPDATSVVSIAGEPADIPAPETCAEVALPIFELEPTEGVVIDVDSGGGSTTFTLIDFDEQDWEFSVPFEVPIAVGDPLDITVSGGEVRIARASELLLYVGSIASAPVEASAGASRDCVAETACPLGFGAEVELPGATLGWGESGEITLDGRPYTARVYSASVPLFSEAALCPLDGMLSLVAL